MSFILLGILNSQAAAAGGGNAFDLLESTILSSTASSVTFSNLGNYSDYKHLQIRLTARSTDSNSLRLRVNSDTATNYSSHGLTFSGSGSGGPNPVAAINQTFIQLPNLSTNVSNNSGVFSAVVIDLLDFGVTTKNKTFKILGGNWQAQYFNSQTSFRSGVWRNTAAITSIQIYPNTTEFVSGSRFSLYGVK